MKFQVKYTNQDDLRIVYVSSDPEEAGKYAFGSEASHRSNQPDGAKDESLSSSGSNQAREGRLVDALAVRGDEGRDTLR